MRRIREFFILTSILCLLPLLSHAQEGIQNTAATSTPRNRAMITVPNVASGSTTSRTIRIRFPQGADRGSVKVNVNGKDVSTRFQDETCTGALCLSANLTADDGLVVGENIVYVLAKSQDGTASSARLHFTAGDTTHGVGGTQRSLLSPRALTPTSQLSASNLPTNSTFLPPTVLFQTTQSSGVEPNKPWFTLGSLQQVMNGNCTSMYSVIVLDRRTLVQKTSAPESSPQCFASSSTLKPYLQSLAGYNDIVIVGTNAGQVADANQVNTFDTSSIGGMTYNCNANCSTPTSNDAPVNYLGIGVPGAAVGSAYESYTVQGSINQAEFAIGMFVEDATGNYNFVSSNNAEFTVSPGSTAGNTSLTVMNAPSAPGMNVVYGPPTGSANGFWLMVFDRNSITSYPGCSQSGTNGNTISIPNCGTFFPLGADQGNSSQILALANALNAVDNQHIAVLTTVGTAGWGTPIVMASDNNTANNTIPLAEALLRFGIPDKSILFTGTQGSTWTMVGVPGLGGPLNGHNLLSSSYFSQQGQTGYIHGTFARDNHGLYEPSHSEQQSAGNDTANLQLGLIVSQQPVEWPEYSALPNATSVAGQVDAYKYLSYYLLNGWYLQGQATSATAQDPGIAGDMQYDIHYFFTGSLNTLLDYHTFDPLDAVFPGGVTPNHRTIPCASTSGTSPVTCNWTGPDGTQLTFTSNDFAAVQLQLHNELVALNNVLTFLVTGSTNMKDIVAAGNSNAALTLIQAITEVQANINEPLPAQATAAVSPWHIMNMIASDISPYASLITDGVVNSADITLADKTIGFVGDLFHMAGGTGGGISTMDTNSKKQIPSNDYNLDVAVSSLATADLQGAILAGFDSTLDVITGDWGKLQALGGAPANNSPLFAPTQSTQNQVIQMITNASQKSLYVSLIPQVFQVHKWGMTGYVQNSAGTPILDLGYSKNGDTGSCKGFYDNTQTAWVAVGYPTYGGTTYWESWQSLYPDQYWPFFNVYNGPFLDWYIFSLPFTNPGTTNPTAKAMDSNLSNILFGNSTSSVNFVRDEFIADAGPMNNLITGGPSALFDLAFEVDGSNGNYSPNTNYIGLNNFYVCSLQLMNGTSDTTLGGPETVGTSTITTLTMPSSAVLGNNVTLQAKVTVAATAAPAGGRVQFRDGDTVLATVNLDATGSASYTATGLALGAHNMAAYFISTDGSLPSDSGVQPLTVYSTVPDMQLTLSQSTLTVSYGQTSSPVSLKVLAVSGMNGTITYACSGLPAGMSCTFSPATSSIADGATATTSFTISGTPIAASSASFVTGKGLGLLVSAASLLFLLPIHRRRPGIFTRVIFPLLVITLAAGSILGCSGGTTSKTTTFQEAGSKSVLVTATSGNLTKTTPLVVTIQ